MELIEATLANLGFVEAIHVKGRASIADLFHRSTRCGIYVLHFSGDEYYAGKAVDVTRRYAQHRKVHADIERISFKCVPENRLDENEPLVISTLEAGGFRLRNIQFTSFPIVASDFDTVMSPEEQDRWLADPTYQNLGGSRATNGDLRRKYTAKYRRLCTMPFHADAIRVLRKYVRIGIPTPVRTEMSFWCCSCLPREDKRMTIYSRINIHAQEVFTIGTNDDVLFFSWHLARSPLTSGSRDGGDSDRNVRRSRRLLRFVPYSPPNPFRHRSKEGTLQSLQARFALQLDADGYHPGGLDQLHLTLFQDARKALLVLDEPQMIAAIRRLNLGLMRKGPSLNSLSHCMDLADTLLVL